MKTLILALALLSPLTSLARGGGSSVGSGNPASELCVKIGGTLESMESPEGQYANCVIGQWDLFRVMSERHLVKPIRCARPNMPCMPNPAARNCVVSGGELRSIETPDGTDSACVIEEWKLWKVFHRQ